MNLKKNLFFSLLCLFIAKCIVEDITFADAAILFILVGYRLVNKVIEIKKIEKSNQIAEDKFNKVSEELQALKLNVDSLKIKEQLVNNLGFGVKK